MLYISLIITFFILYIITTSQNREFLEIIETEDKIYFLLSGDEYYVAPIDNGNSEEIIKNVIHRYKKELSTIVERVILTNNRGNQLESELNSIIKL